MCFSLIWQKFIHSFYLWCIHSHTTFLIRKINDGRLQDDKRLVRRAGYCFTKQIYEPVLMFTILRKSLEIIWYLVLSRFNYNLITASTTFSFSRLNLNISVSVYVPLTCNFNVNISWFSGICTINLKVAIKLTMYAELCLHSATTFVGCSLLLKHLLATQLLAVCFLPFFEAYH